MENNMLELKEKIKKVNEILLAEEPGNISYDSYADYTGYKPQCIISAMNEVFGIGQWGFKELSKEKIVNQQGIETIIIVNLEVFIAGVEFKPTAYGQSRITKGDIGDAMKGAQTDAIKKGLSYFSIGERAYLGLLPKPLGKNIRSSLSPVCQKQIKTAAEVKQTLPSANLTYKCVKCGINITKMEHDYSKKKYNYSLCKAKCQSLASEMNSPAIPPA